MQIYLLGQALIYQKLAQIPPKPTKNFSGSQQFLPVYIQEDKSRIQYYISPLSRTIFSVLRTTWGCSQTANRRC